MKDYELSPDNLGAVRFIAWFLIFAAVGAIAWGLS